MDQSQRSRLAAGIILILGGAIFLALQMVPGLFASLGIIFSWPWIIIGVGAGLLLLGLALGAPDMAVPGCIVGGIGGILYYQNYTGNWTSWSYMWALIPGFVGIGILISAIVANRGRKAILDALEAMLTSLILFAIFGSIFGAFTVFGPYWPILLVAAGLLLLVKAFVGGKKPA